MAGKDKCNESGIHNDIREMLQVMNDSMNKHTQYYIIYSVITKIFKFNLLIIGSIWMHILIGK
jgi:hypothetical protein